MRGARVNIDLLSVCSEPNVVKSQTVSGFSKANGNGIIICTLPGLRQISIKTTPRKSDDVISLGNVSSPESSGFNKVDKAKFVSWNLLESFQVSFAPPTPIMTILLSLHPTGESVSQTLLSTEGSLK